MPRDGTRSEHRSRCRELRHRISSPGNEISAHPRQLLEQIWISKRDNDWFSATIDQCVHEVRECLGRAGGSRVPALTDVRADDRYISRIGSGDQSWKVECGVFGGDELSAQF